MPGLSSHLFLHLYLLNRFASRSILIWPTALQTILITLRQDSRTSLTVLIRSDVHHQFNSSLRDTYGRLGSTKAEILFLGTAIFVTLTRTVASQDLDNITIGGKVIDQNGAVTQGALFTATLVSINTERRVVTGTIGKLSANPADSGRL